jgi:hypothetical protein
MTGQLPQVNALLLCDLAFQQAVTGKWCIIGTFSVIWVREFPATHSPLVAFVSLSDFTGNAMVQLTIRDPAGEHVISVRGQIPQLPQSLFELAFMFPPVTLKEPGSYSIELHAGGELLTVRSFRVEKHNFPNMPYPGGPTPEQQPPPPSEG